MSGDHSRGNPGSHPPQGIDRVGGGKEDGVDANVAYKVGNSPFHTFEGAIVVSCFTSQASQSIVLLLFMTLGRLRSPRRTQYKASFSISHKHTHPSKYPHYEFLKISTGGLEPSSIFHKVSRHAHQHHTIPQYRQTDRQNKKTSSPRARAHTYTHTHTHTFKADKNPPEQPPSRKS